MDRLNKCRWFILIAFAAVSLVMIIYQIIYVPQKRLGSHLLPFDIRKECNIELMLIREAQARYTNETKIIYSPSFAHKSSFQSLLKFGECEFSNCVFQYCFNEEHMDVADVVLFEFNSGNLLSVTRPVEVRQRQLWLVYSHESPIGYPTNKWNSVINSFNGSMTYRSDSSIYYPFFVTLKSPSRTRTVNYAAGKTKGAYAYVSHCRSSQYNRLSIMKKLSKYVDVEIRGRCVNKESLCPNFQDLACEAAKHSEYRFYFAFENSLCKDYITEKFFARLRSSGYFIPVAIGGLSVDEYYKVAPPNSFIHAYNFSSIDHLGKYLQHLMTDDDALNRYHEWRQHYTITDRPRSTACDLCKAANNPESIQPAEASRLADDWNNITSCRALNMK